MLPQHPRPCVGIATALAALLLAVALPARASDEEVRTVPARPGVTEPAGRWPA